MNERGRNIAISSYDDIFGQPAQSGDETENGERVTEISIRDLHAFRRHPFQVNIDDELKKMIDSISDYGVLSPVIVRPRARGGYEIVSGHRRAKAADMAGLFTIPCIVRNLDDDAATILMVDSNLQRENILPSERAWAFRMKLEAMKRQAGRPSLENGGQVGHNLLGVKSRDEMAEQIGESGRQIQRYIRLTYLLPQLLYMVDSKQLAFNPAVEISYLPPEKQNHVISAMDYAQNSPSLSQAQRIRKLAKTKEYSPEKVEEILNEEKKQELDHVTIKNELIKKYFPKSYTPKQMEDTIIKLLEQWQKKRNRDMTL